MLMEKVLRAAVEADQAYEEALRLAGYKARWCKHVNTPAIQAAYDAKVAADRAVGAAFEAQRDIATQKKQA